MLAVWWSSHFQLLQMPSENSPWLLSTYFLSHRNVQGKKVCLWGTMLIALWNQKWHKHRDRKAKCRPGLRICEAQGKQWHAWTLALAVAKGPSPSIAWHYCQAAKAMQWVAMWLHCEDPVNGRQVWSPEQLNWPDWVGSCFLFEIGSWLASGYLIIAEWSYGAIQSKLLLTGIRIRLRLQSKILEAYFSGSLN